MSLDTLPGNPAAFERSLGAYHRGAAAIDDAITALDRLSTSSDGEAMRAVLERVTVVRSGITVAQGRYSQTANALDHYAESFEQAHLKANQAVNAYDAANQSRLWAARRVDDLEDDLRIAAQSAAPEADLQVIQNQLYRARDDVREAEWALGEARGNHSNAERDLDQAAQYAISAIDSVFGQTNDSWTDHVGSFLSGVGDFLAAIAEWIGGVLKAVLDGLIEVILVLLDAIAAVLIVLTLLLVVLIPGYFILVGLIAAALFLVTELLGVPDQWQLWIVAGFLGITIPTLGLFILNRAVHEALSPTPSITYAETESDLIGALGDSYEDNLKSQEGVRDLRDPDYIPTDVGTLVERVGDADNAGGDHHTVLDIVTITDQYGNERHIVTMPSTADWGHISELMGNGGGLADGGATNDLDANLVEMLFPDLIDTQYERAALEALRQLIDSGEPVMFVGFSQGGIMSSLMVDQHGTEFSAQALVTAGTPHSTFTIPKTVEHFNVAHVGDGVTMLDMSVDSSNVDTGMHRSVVAFPQPGQTTHGADSYGLTARQNDYATEGMFSDFLVDPADVASGKVSVTSTQAIWSEAG